jgi:hypothetical protein
MVAGGYGRVDIIEEDRVLGEGGFEGRKEDCW